MRPLAAARHVLATALLASASLLAAPTAYAQEAPQPQARPLAAATVSVYPPIQGGSVWNRFGQTPPSSHHRVFSNWGYLNDWSVDIYQNPGATVVSPFGSKTSAGGPVTVRVVTVTPGCATGNLADGGWRIGLEARDDSTGTVVGRADVMHVDQKPGSIAVGATVGPWTRLGQTGRFRYSSCYQVNGDTGAHIHLEVINRTKYSCYIARSAGAGLGDETVVGRVGTLNSGPQQAC
ncbi:MULTISPECIES: hypothetical protein [Streptomyces]|uniref:Peptidase family M23 n=1 Tax=Streptomyces microflavus TaxID=1919 RepID=A0A6N9VK15_STRMI|nr:MULTISPECIES: hypothetical protein [Streptomyces]MBK5995500.1 hypothetical protein [Streptomyces sp. MBT58]MBW3360904.1 hypothetical protein [Streptomyces sp. 09ZI22]MEE1732141.1 hypothetical protein [Streptomyces sp. BE282]NEB73226.1 hypothetical protein [Streptomyces microflavus]QTA34508.1 hypothetical protein JHY03_47060 [Streptomyces sp. CA-256286]